jgi:hypothetical protein
MSVHIQNSNYPDQPYKKIQHFVCAAAGGRVEMQDLIEDQYAYTVTRIKVRR